MAVLGGQWGWRLQPPPSNGGPPRPLHSLHWPRAANRPAATICLRKLIGSVGSANIVAGPADKASSMHRARAVSHSCQSALSATTRQEQAPITTAPLDYATRGGTIGLLSTEQPYPRSIPKMNLRRLFGTLKRRTACGACGGTKIPSLSTSSPPLPTCGRQVGGQAEVGGRISFEPHGRGGGGGRGGRGRFQRRSKGVNTRGTPRSRRLPPPGHARHDTSDY